MSDVRRSKRAKPDVVSYSKPKPAPKEEPKAKKPRTTKQKNATKIMLNKKNANKAKAKPEPEPESEEEEEEEVESEEVEESEDEVVEVRVKRERMPHQIGKGGIPLICGTLDWDLIGREKKEVKLTAYQKKNLKKRKQEPAVEEARVEPTWVPEIISSLAAHRITKIVSSCVAVHSVFLSAEGQAFTMGRNEQGQLGLGNLERQDKAMVVSTLKKQFIVNAACGAKHTFFITFEGEVYGCGANKTGQLGIGSKVPFQSTVEKVDINVAISSASGGFDSSLFVSKTGQLFSCGSSENGQLGNNDAGQSIEKAGKVLFNCEKRPILVDRFFSRDDSTKEVLCLEDVRIKQVNQGPHHCCAVSEGHELFTWGFNGHHRLGHGKGGNLLTDDILVPMRVNVFPPNDILGVKSAQCSSVGMMANCHRDFFYYWGSNSTSKMESPYPKAMAEFYDWNITDYAGGRNHIVISAQHKNNKDISTISFGTGSKGELGMANENGTKTMSRANPDKMETMEGIHVTQVALGAGHTLLLAADDTEERNALLDQLDVNTDC